MLIRAPPTAIFFFVRGVVLEERKKEGKIFLLDDRLPFV